MSGGLADACIIANALQSEASVLVLHMRDDGAHALAWSNPSIRDPLRIVCLAWFGRHWQRARLRGRAWEALFNAWPPQKRGEAVAGSHLSVHVFQIGSECDTGDASCTVAWMCTRPTPLPMASRSQAHTTCPQSHWNQAGFDRLLVSGRLGRLRTTAGIARPRDSWVL